MGSDGRVWIQVFPHAGERSESWTVIEADGRFVDEVVLAPAFQHLRAGARHLAGIYRDNDGVEYVRVFDVTERR